MLMVGFTFCLWHFVCLIVYYKKCTTLTFIFVLLFEGSLSTLACQSCGAKVSADQVRNDILAGNVPRCTRSRTRPKRKRPTSNEIKSQPVIGPLCNGVLKPGITFFGEKLVDKVTRSLEQDRSKADAVIVIGTSLSV